MRSLVRSAPRLLRRIVVCLVLSVLVAPAPARGEVTAERAAAALVQERPAARAVVLLRPGRHVARERASELAVQAEVARGEPVRRPRLTHGLPRVVRRCLRIATVLLSATAPPGPFIEPARPQTVELRAERGGRRQD